MSNLDGLFTFTVEEALEEMRKKREVENRLNRLFHFTFISPIEEKKVDWDMTIKEYWDKYYDEYRVGDEYDEPTMYAPIEDFLEMNGIKADLLICSAFREVVFEECEYDFFEVSGLYGEEHKDEKKWIYKSTDTLLDVFNDIYSHIRQQHLDFLLSYQYCYHSDNEGGATTDNLTVIDFIEMCGGTYGVDYVYSDETEIEVYHIDKEWI